MKLLSRLSSSSNKRFLIFTICLLFPTVLFGQAVGSKPFKISKQSEFACAEVDNPVIGSPASHEIVVDSTRVERCLLKKVGSRLNECKKLKFGSATADSNGIVTLDTEEGPVRFSFIELGSNTKGESTMVLVWTWPDTPKKYLCTAADSRR